MKQITRSVVKKVFAQEQSEGVGARVRRSIGTRELRNLSPFLMLDHFRVDEGAGFADHPHRGQSTVTYMIDGYSQHEDFAGHRGKLGPGDLQWMIAGRGIMHAEMPMHYDDKGKKLPVPIGLQLWVDLPSHAKMSEPQYQEMSASEVPSAAPRAGEPEETEGRDWSMKVIAGRSHGVESPVRSPENGGCWYFDINVQPGGWVFQEIPHGWNAFIYVIEGGVAVGPSDEVHEQYNTLVLANPALKSQNEGDAKHLLSNIDGVRIKNPTDKPARAVLIAGEPLDHPVVQYGPFVMCSMKEVYEAIDDFRNARNGFERAATWRSEIAKPLMHG
ncbi:hypothetical protein MCUN1_002421 [Malassezia cuniculi]|uniref:Pirin n=1 Tax=Malassezia cuniculi TaxID=948313 RepID=A0AAF0J6Y7_9BASI|nr:hypothetical protein MCUN1_002421 [Malassezia cuniculi]